VSDSGIALSESRSKKWETENKRKIEDLLRLPTGRFYIIFLVVQASNDCLPAAALERKR
jgi:hypothetical protein